MQFFRFMNRPLRYISREAVGEKADFSQMVRYYQGRPAMQETLLRLQADLERIKGMPVFLAVNYIRKAMGYEDYCMEQYGQTGLELIDLVQGSTRGCKTMEQWRHVIDERRREKPVPAAAAEGVTLLTMHASKGLEYGKVFMINCNEGITPHRKARTSEEIEEERRMFYVGMTRAKKELVCFYVSGGGKEDDSERPMPPSRFLEEFGDFKN